MGAIIAIVGFIAFLGFLELLIYVVNRIRKHYGAKPFNIDGSELFMLIIAGLFVFYLIGELYVRITQ